MGIFLFASCGTRSWLFVLVTSCLIKCLTVTCNMLLLWCEENLLPMRIPVWLVCFCW